MSVGAFLRELHFLCLCVVCDMHNAAVWTPAWGLGGPRRQPHAHAPAHKLRYDSFEKSPLRTFTESHFDYLFIHLYVSGGTWSGLDWTTR